MTGTVSFGLFALALTVTTCLAAISEVKTNNPVTQKPGRFLSLPVPQKCSQSEWEGVGVSNKRRRPKTSEHENRHFVAHGVPFNFNNWAVDVSVSSERLPVKNYFSK